MAKGHGAKITAAAVPIQWVRYDSPAAWLLWTQLGWLTLDITTDGWAIMALMPAGGFNG